MPRGGVLELTVGPAKAQDMQGTGEETPVFFQAGEESLAGIFGTPARDPSGVGVIALPGGWKGTSTGRNRVIVRLCRRLMAAGCHTFRFDYAGTGESSGSVERFTLDRPSDADVLAAAQWLADNGVSRVVVAGFCYGAWTALWCAHRIAGLHGLAMVAIPLNLEVPIAHTQVAPRVKLSRLLRYAMRPWFLRQLLSANRRRLYRRYLAAKWKTIRRGHARVRGLPVPDEHSGPSPEFLSRLSSTLDRSVPVLFLYGTKDFEREDFDRARSGPLGEIIEACDPLVEARTVPGYLHELADIDVQESLIESVAEWVGMLGPPASAHTKDHSWTSSGLTSSKNSATR